MTRTATATRSRTARGRPQPVRLETAEQARHWAEHFDGRAALIARDCDPDRPGLCWRNEDQTWVQLRPLTDAQWAHATPTSEALAATTSDLEDLAPFTVLWHDEDATAQTPHGETR